jgi:plasmid segregation protein ParM
MIIRPLDIGYQITKMMRKKKNKWELFSMPSIAPIYSGIDMSGGLMEKRDTEIVEVNTMLYEVGPDANDLQSSDTVKALDANYITSDAYKAIFYGSLAYIGEEVIDLLVVGLPVSNLVKKEELRNLMIGEHNISDKKTITVKDALVIPQPLGGLYAALNSSDEDLLNIKTEYNLIVDPGSVTFDFLFTHGKKAIENRSDAYPGGMIKVLKSIAKSIQEKHKKPYSNLTAIENALKQSREKRLVKLPWQKEKEDLLEHIKNTKSVLENSVTAMKNKVGDGSEQQIDNIILVGGGASIFQKQIQIQYEHFEIKILDKPTFPKLKNIENYNPMYGNVVGYAFAGAEYSGIDFDEIK